MWRASSRRELHLDYQWQVKFSRYVLANTVIYLVNKPLLAGGMSADNVRGWEIVRKMNIWSRSEASRANVKFWGQSLSQGHYQPTYQQARKGFIYFITLPLIFILAKLNRFVNMVKQASGDLMANARDWRVGVNLIGLTNFISTVIRPNLTSCHVKLIIVTPLGTWRIWFIQLFRQRLSKESVKAYATMPKGSLGNIKVSIKAPAEQCLGRKAKTWGGGQYGWKSFWDTALTR